MNYLDTLTTNPNGHIQKAVQLIQQLPVTHWLSNTYSQSTRNELTLIGTATFLTLYNFISYIKSKREKLNLPPTVPFGLPLLGHTLYLAFFPKKFIDWCNSKYGEVYNIHHLGKLVTIASGRCAEEAMKAESSELSLEHGILRDTLHFQYAFESATMQIGFHINPGVAKLTIPSHKMAYYIPGIQQGLEIAVKDLMSTTEPTIVNQPSSFFQKFVSYMSVPTLVGEEVATNPEVIKSFAEFTGDITKNVPLFMATPKFLHPFILPYLQSIRKHHAIMEKNIIPVITERRRKMKEAEENSKPHNLDDNFLQGLIEYIEIKPDGTKVTIPDKELAHSVLLIAFAATHTTSVNLSFAVYWLIARPDLMQKLMDEIKQVAPGNTPVDADALKNMKFLNNFMREVLRQGVDKLANGKKAMVDFTFSNGYQVPKGRIVESNVRQLQFGDNSTRTEIDEMDPELSQNRSSSSPAKDFVPFGMGKHLCPGRFFAIQEIEMALIHLLKNYDIKTVSGKKPTPVGTLAGKMSINSEMPLIFTPRKL